MGNSITNKPSGLDAIGLIVIHNATGGYYTQILTTSTNANTYRRTCQNNTWSAWTQDKYTDTTYAAMKGATSSAAGTAGLVPAPAAGAQGKFLRGDGTWQTISSSSKLDAWPVGSIYQTTGSTSPASLFGGTWEEIASERALMGASTSHTAGSTVDAGLPNIAGTFTALQRYYQQGYPAEMIYFAPTGAFNYTEGTHVIKQGDSSTGNLNKNFDYTFDASRSSSVYGNSTTVQPAAYYVHIWHRIA